MPSNTFDLFVFGAGSGGVRAARMAASYGASVAIAESNHLGGTCVNLGCIPKKLFTYAAHYGEMSNHARGFGWTIKAPVFDLQTFVNNKNSEISRLNEVYGELLNKSGVHVIKGKAVLIDANTIRVDNNSTYRANKILLATGSLPQRPQIPGTELSITSNEVFHLTVLPERIIIVGGGYIAVEFASIFNCLGVEVTLIYRGEKILRGFDDSVRDFVSSELLKKGIKILNNTEINSLNKTNNSIIASITSTNETLTTDLIMYAIGRFPNTKTIGLENAGVKTAPNGAVIIDDNMQTSQANIFAIGDVVDRVQLTPVAIAEAMAVTKTMFLNTPTKVDYQNIATTVFCNPNIGTVGLTEVQARAQHPRGINIYESEFCSLKDRLTGSTERAIVKLIENKTNGLILGVHMVGTDAGEVIQGMAIAIQAKATKAVFDSTIAIHPTLAEEFVSMRQITRN